MKCRGICGIIISQYLFALDIYGHGVSDMIKTIVLQGDSHTWGEGVGGEFLLGAPSQAADVRKLCFAPPCYANLIRRRVCDATGSAAYDIDWRHISLMYTGDVTDASVRRGCTAILPGRPFTVKSPAGFVLCDFRHTAAPTAARVLIDGEPAAEIDLQGPERDGYDDDYVRLPAWCDDGGHEVTVEAVKGEPLLRRMEFHSGRYAVIASGFGSRSIKEYLAGYWESDVAAFRPDIVVLECNTINDWLRKEPPETYGEYVRDLIEAARALTDRIIVHNVFPVMGGEAEPMSEYEFSTLNKRVRSAAIGMGVESCFADVSALAKERMKGLEEWQKAMYFYHDCWHPNERGYAVYADAIWEKMEPML